MSQLSLAYIKRKALERYLTLFVHPPAPLKEIPGYLHPLECRFLSWLAARVPSRGLALEVGSYKGKSSAHLAAGLSADATLACVDTWFNDAMPYDAQTDVLPEFLKNVNKYREKIQIYRSSSREAAKTWQHPIDLLFIDGDHSYEGCKSDLESWITFVKPGGCIAFHDSSEPGVSRAISELFPKRLRQSELNVWSIFAAVKRSDCDEK